MYLAQLTKPRAAQIQTLYMWLPTVLGDSDAKPGLRATKVHRFEVPSGTMISTVRTSVHPAFPWLWPEACLGKKVGFLSLGVTIGIPCK